MEYEMSSSQLAGSTDEECKRVALMREHVQEEEPSSKDADSSMLRRFLRAHDQNVDKASASFLKYLSWRKAAAPNGFISESDIKKELSQEKTFLQGFDRSGRPIVVAFGAKHYYSKRDMDEFKRFCVYFFDTVCSSMPIGQEKFVCIADLTGWGYSNCDIRAYLAALDIMQNRYPERLGKVYLIHVPYMFMKAWKIVYPVIHNSIKEKFVFVEDKRLLEDIDESQLPEIYGGKLPLVPIYESKFQY